MVFSPLAAVLVGTGVAGVPLRGALRGMAGPVWASVQTALLAAVIAVLIGMPYAILVEQSGRWRRRLFWSLGLLVLVIPPYLVSESWIVLFGPVGRISRACAILLGFAPQSNDPVEVARFTVPGFVFTWPAVGMVMGGCLFPLVALAAGSALRRTDHRVFESARLAQGALGVWRIGAQVLMPPSVGAALLVFAVTLAEFAVPQLLRVRTAGEAVYEQVQEGNLGTAGAMVLVLAPLVVASGILGAWVLLRSRSAALAALEGEIPRFGRRDSAGMRDFFAGMATLGAMTPAIFLPLVSLAWLVSTARRPAGLGAGTHRVLRADGFLDSFRGAWDLTRDDALRTVLLAGLAATLATAFAIVLARGAARLGWGPFLGMMGAGLAVPAPVVGLGLIILWNRAWTSAVYQGLAIVILGWLARFFPVSVLLVQGALARVPPELERAAALMGRGPFERLAGVVFPGAAPGLAASWIAFYVLSATEFGTTLLVAPPGRPLLAPSIVNLMRRGHDSEIAACQFLLLAVVALPAIAALLLAAVWRRSGLTRSDYRE